MDAAESAPLDVFPRPSKMLNKLLGGTSASLRQQAVDAFPVDAFSLKCRYLTRPTAQDFLD